MAAGTNNLLWTQEQICRVFGNVMIAVQGCPKSPYYFMSAMSVSEASFASLSTITSPEKALEDAIITQLYNHFTKYEACPGVFILNPSVQNIEALREHLRSSVNGECLDTLIARIMSSAVPDIWPAFREIVLHCFTTDTVHTEALALKEALEQATPESYEEALGVAEFQRQNLGRLGAMAITNHRALRVNVGRDAGYDVSEPPSQPSPSEGVIGVSGFGTTEDPDLRRESGGDRTANTRRVPVNNTAKVAPEPNNAFMGVQVEGIQQGNLAFVFAGAKVEGGGKDFLTGVDDNTPSIEG